MKQTLLLLSLPLLVACGTSYVDHERAPIGSPDAGCASHSEEPPAQCLAMVVDPTVFMLGEVVVQTTSTVTVTVTNDETTDAELALGGASNFRRCDVLDDPSVFCLAPSNGSFTSDSTLIVPAEDSIDLQIRFSPIIPETRERGTATLHFVGTTACTTELRADGVGVDP